MSDKPDTIVIYDFGGQYCHLIGRRIREMNVYCEIVSHNAKWNDVAKLNPKGIILSGSPFSVHDAGAPTLDRSVLQSGVPMLGICYGLQLIAHQLGGAVERGDKREYGHASVEMQRPGRLLHGLPATFEAWMSHGDTVTRMPDGFSMLACTTNTPFAAVADDRRHMYGIQFHAEVTHTPLGVKVLRNFVFDICACRPNWELEGFLERSVKGIRATIKNTEAICAVSGGVDSTVAAALVHQAIGDRLHCVFVDTGLLRKHEAQEIVTSLRSVLETNVHAVDASERFLHALEGVTDPEHKRKRIGETFVRVFEAEAEKLGHPRWLVQGTLYPDVIESATGHQTAGKIKTHHNVGGLPTDIRFSILEPLRYLFKDEVRRLGPQLGVPDSVLRRQPFPGPGLAVRIIGEVTEWRLALLREADAIVREVLEESDVAPKLGQYFAVLTPISSVGVMGDGRTYGNVLAVRAVSTDDFMTAEPVALPHDVTTRLATRIVNEVEGVNRVVYDITSKPPATIEWE